MTAEEMAAIHAVAMTTPPPWSAPTFEGFIAFPGAVLASEDGGFALGRVIADEAEVLTVAVAPDHRRRGIARRCLAALEAQARSRGAARLFLEVAEDNGAARALYESAGYLAVGRRKAYYRTEGGAPVDAILMEKTLGTA